MPRIALDTLAWLIEDAFQGDPDQSLLAILRDLWETDWLALPPGANRSIAEILEHVAWSKWMYENYAFGGASLRGDEPPLIPRNGAGWARFAPYPMTLNWSVSASPTGVTICLRVP